MVAIDHNLVLKRGGLRTASIASKMSLGSHTLTKMENTKCWSKVRHPAILISQENFSKFYVRLRCYSATTIRSHRPLLSFPNFFCPHLLLALCCKYNHFALWSTRTKQRCQSQLPQGNCATYLQAAISWKLQSSLTMYKIKIVSLKNKQINSFVYLL